MPILQGDKQWGTLEVAFVPLTGEGMLGFAKDPIFGLIAFLVWAIWILSISVQLLRARPSVAPA